MSNSHRLVTSTSPARATFFAALPALGARAALTPQRGFSGDFGNAPPVDDGSFATMPPGSAPRRATQSWGGGRCFSLSEVFEQASEALLNLLGEIELGHVWSCCFF